MRARAAELFDDGEKCGAEANTAKFVASEASWQAANICLDTHGGYGFVDHYDIERNFRETRVYQVAPVNNNMILAFLGQNVLGLPRSAPYPASATPGSRAGDRPGVAEIECAIATGCARIGVRAAGGGDYRRHGCSSRSRGGADADGCVAGWSGARGRAGRRRGPPPLHGGSCGTR